MSTWKHSDDFLARWLNNELSEEERKAFEASEEFESFQKIAEESSKLMMPEYSTASEFQKLKVKRQQSAKKAKIFTLRRWAVAATFLIAVSLASIYIIIQQPGEVLYTTQSTERNSYTLPDGSTVVLNAESSISFDEATWEDERTITLTGEAFFSVIKGSPFKVMTDLGSVEVLGTEFNVKVRNNTLDAACYEGRIAVEVDTESRELNPGKAITYRQGEEIEERSFEEIEAPTWVSGISSFERVPLEFALDELKRQYAISVESDVVTDSLFYTGSFPNNNLNAAIRLVLDPFEVEYNYDAEAKILYISPRD